ncbi:MAG: glycosyl transferase [Desulfuromonas sp.]|nr:MAG: glycosyl transferase [Desulfuromonas sp.]
MTISLPSPPESICILRLSALGDVSHVLPTLRTLQKTWPDCRITWVIGKTEHALVGDIPEVEFIVFDKSKGVKAYLQLAKDLKRREFDILLHMQVALRASLASLLIKAPIRLGFDKFRARNGQALFTNHQIAAVEKQHVLDSFLEFPKALGIEEAVLEWNIPIPEQAEQKAADLLPADKKILAINPCTSNRARNWRNWSVENYASIIGHVFEKYGMITVLTGGPSKMEVDYAERIERASRHKPINLVGKTSVKELLAVLKRSDLMISPDTGPAHMANAVGTPVVGLYATSNPYRTGPYNSLDITINKYPEALDKESGKSVEDVRWGKRVRNPEAMELISNKDVISNLNNIVFKNQTDENIS